MEGVAALGEEPELVERLELAEADGAVKRPLGGVGAGDGGVLEDGEGVDEGLVDAGVVEVEELLELALQRRDALGVIVVLADEEVEEAKDEEDDCEN